LTVAARATALLVDVIEVIHDAVYNVLLNDDRFGHQADRIAIALDALGEAATRVEVVGEVEFEAKIASPRDSSRGGEVAASVAAGKLSASARRSKQTKQRNAAESRRLSRGQETFHLLFGQLSRSLQSLALAAVPAQIWVLLDECR
jgi:hypothetical protein